MRLMILSLSALYLATSICAADEMFSGNLVEKVGAAYIKDCKLPCSEVISGARYELSTVKISNSDDLAILVVSKTDHAGSAGYPSMIIRRVGIGWIKIFEAFSFTMGNETTGGYYNIVTSGGNKYIWNGEKYALSSDNKTVYSGNGAVVADAAPQFPPVLHALPQNSTLPIGTSWCLSGNILIQMNRL